MVKCLKGWSWFFGVRVTIDGSYCVLDGGGRIHRGKKRPLPQSGYMAALPTSMYSANCSQYFCHHLASCEITKHQRTVYLQPTVIGLLHGVAYFTGTPNFQG